MRHTDIADSGRFRRQYAMRQLQQPLTDRHRQRPPVLRRNIAAISLPQPFAM
jgi:hypothetical protein